jgi:hypothetical protein
MTLIYAPVSIGDLWDKITILHIKKEEYTKNLVNNPVNSTKIGYVEKELEELMKIIEGIPMPESGPVTEQVTALKEVNHMIWRNEEVSRTYGEGLKDYDNEFIKIAAQTHMGNATRCQIKLDINMLYGSYIVETKSYINEGL